MLLGDDAAGPVVSVRLGGVDCGAAPENYISKLRKDKPDILIIIDAAEMGLKAGSVRAMSLDEIGGSVFTSHGIPLSALLEQFNETINIFFIGIQPKQTNPGEPLSDEVKAAVEFIAEKLGKLF
ncbi:MAG: hydrogenase maturation protease [Synergistaceae bacterium]|nr:hydrogenase maturation protease [Synergistaceae bacterium]